MNRTRKTFCALACAAACLLLAACGSGSGSGGSAVGLTPFQTEITDTLPAGTRIDVSSKNLFQMGSGDIWYYTSLDAGGNPGGTFATRAVASDDGAGHVSLVENDGGPDTTDYIVSADGLLDTYPLGSTPASMAGIVGGIFEYATPLYPVGAERKHVRSGPWGEDLDGDGIGESFRFEFTQVFLGFESVQLSSVFTLTQVAHFHNVVKLTLRPTASGHGDITETLTEDAWFAPDMGMVKAQRTTLDSGGNVLDPPHTLVFHHGFVGSVNWDTTAPVPVLDGSIIDVPLKHNALVYDVLRNVYYASVPGSVTGNGNRIATVDPATGQVSYSAPVGSEPNALAITADASTLYAGTDGTGDIVKLALPAMTELGRARLPVETLGQKTAKSIAVSPVDPTVVAVSLGEANSGSFDGVALLRDMVLQPTVAFSQAGNVVTFDPSGSKLYGLNNESSEFGLRRIQVLPDGLAVEFEVPAASDFGTRVLSFVGNQVVAGHGVYATPGLDRAGLVGSQSDCLAQRSGGLLLCFNTLPQNTGPSRVIVADAATFVLGASLLYALSEPGGPRRMVEGPPGQLAISYAANPSGFVSKIRLFTSALLLAPPVPPVPVWPVSASTTPDGQALDVAVTHNDLVFDSVRNVYYASIPGSVVRSGNSIARIDPATGQVTHSAPIGSEPTLLALAADASALYVGLNGSGDLLELALPSMSELGRLHLPALQTVGQGVVETLAASPVDPTLVTISTNSAPLGLFVQNLVVLQQSPPPPPPPLAANVSGAAVCASARSGIQLLCLATQDPFATPAGRILVADSSTFAVTASPIFNTNEPFLFGTIRKLVQGPPGQAAINYAPPFGPAPPVRLFSSGQLP